MFAPFIGSFLGVVIERLPVGRPLILARSECASCRQVLAPRDLVPLLSYTLLGGRCRSCGAAIGWFNPAIELAALAVAVWAVLASSGDAGGTWLDCGLGWTLLTLGWIDWRWMILPDVLTLPLLLAGLVGTLLWRPAAIGHHAIGAAAGYLALRGLDWCYRCLRGRSGIGAGDAKLLGAAGAWLGWAPLPIVVMIAASGGILAALLLAALGRRMRAETAMPFGTFLAAAFWLLWMFPA